MKLVKKIVPVMLSLTLCAGMVAPAFAHTVAIDGAAGTETVGTVQEGVDKIAGSDTKSGTITLDINGVKEDNYTKNDNDTYTFHENVVIDDNVDVTLDLNGNTLQNDEGAIKTPSAPNNYKDGSTLSVEKGSKLTVEDSSEAGTGTVDNVTHQKAAIWNEGTAVLEGGTFERSEEKGTDTPGPNGTTNVNTYYTIVNVGYMEIGEDVTVKNEGSRSSAVVNAGVGDTTSTMNINGATITGGKYAVKNEIGTLTIENAEITSYATTGVGSYGTTTIKNSMVSGGTYAVWALAGETTIENCTMSSTRGETVYASEYYGPGKVIINSGNFKGKGLGTEDEGTIVVNGGTFSTDTDLEKYLAEDVVYIAVNNPDDGEYTYQVGTLKVSDETVNIGAETFTPKILLGGKDVTGNIADTSPNGKITWSSSNGAVATVDENGAVTAVGVGKATITATLSDDSTIITYTVTVNATPVVVPGGPGEIEIDDEDTPLGETPNDEVEIDDEAVPLAAGPVTRAQFVDYLWRHEGRPESAPTTFGDVSEDHEYYGAIGWAEANGIAVGLDGGANFAPDELVTVGQARLFLTRYAGYLGIEMPELTALTGEDGEIALNCDEVIAEFFGE